MSRSALLESWLASVFKDVPYTCTPLAGDASLRRYWRVMTSTSSYVVMDAPPPETTQPFIEIGALLASQGLSVPTVLASDPALGFLLLSDFGDQVYLSALQSVSLAEPLYQDALSALVKIHSVKPESISRFLPVFDTGFMHTQLTLFSTWYLKKHLQKDEQAIEDWKQLGPLMDDLLSVIASQPMVFIHRDYHSRNLMVLEHKNPGVLDFQDAMMGPITYDVVSLFQDCYISWPREQIVYWVLDFKKKLINATLLNPHVLDAQFIQWFDWTGVQRHLKNLGIFARLYHRDGKAQYLSDMPMILKYISETCHQYPVLMPLWHFFEDIQVGLTCEL